MTIRRVTVPEWSVTTAFAS